MKFAALYIFAALLFAAGTGLQAQDAPSRFQKQHLVRTQQMLIQGLAPGNAEMQITTTQTIRDIQLEFPDEPFTNLIDPLITLVKLESANVTARLLGLLALDGLHSDKGDIAIMAVMNATENQSVKALCTALTAKGLR